METLEEEIIARFRQLDAAAQQRVLDHLRTEARTQFDYNAWWAEVEALQVDIAAHLGKDGTVGALDLLDELREEAP